MYPPLIDKGEGFRVFDPADEELKVEEEVKVQPAVRKKKKIIRMPPE